MKKVIAVVSIFVFVAAMFSSCKSTKPCPAYSSVKVEKTIPNV